jgi:sigma-54 specific flagellar transcriptional regulator A
VAPVDPIGPTDLAAPPALPMAAADDSASLPTIAESDVGIDAALLRALTADDSPPLVDPCLAAGRPVDLPRLLRRLEEAYIAAALTRTGGNKKAAADLLGLQRTTLVEKLRRRNRDGVALS